MVNRKCSYIFRTANIWYYYRIHIHIHNEREIPHHYLLYYFVSHSAFAHSVAMKLVIWATNKCIQYGNEKIFNKISNYLQFQNLFVITWFLVSLFSESLDTRHSMCSILEKYIFLYAYQDAFDLLRLAQHNNEKRATDHSKTEPMLNESRKKKQNKKKYFSKKILFKDSKSILYCIKFCFNAFSFDFPFSMLFASIRFDLCVCVFGYQFQNCHRHIFHFVDGYCIWSSFAFPK